MKKIKKNKHAVIDVNGNKIAAECIYGAVTYDTYLLYRSELAESFEVD